MSDVLAAPVRFADAIRRPDARGREVETALALHLGPFMDRNRLTSNDMLRALMGNCVAIILAKAQSLDDAQQGAKILCTEIMRRLTDH